MPLSYVSEETGEAHSPALAKRGSPVLRSRDATGEGQ